MLFLMIRRAPSPTRTDTLLPATTLCRSGGSPGAPPAALAGRPRPAGRAWDMATVEDDVARHYGHGSIERAILDGLAAMGLRPDSVRPEDLAAVDEFHMGGRQATTELAERMGLAPGMSLLDIGCGQIGRAHV